MASQGTLTQNLAPPRRPALDDVGGGAKANAANKPPPDPVRGLTADDINQMSKQIVAFAKTTPLCVLTITQAASVFTIAQITAQGDNVLVGVFTILRTSAGNVTITWPAGTFPPSAAAFAIVVNSLTLGVTCGIVAVANGFQFQTGIGAVATDLNCRVEIW